MIIRSLAAAPVLALAAAVAHAQCETGSFVAFAPQAGMAFGCSVAVSGSNAIVGSIGSGGAGDVRIFKRVGATWTQVNVSGPAGANESYASSVALSGNVGVVGAAGRTTPFGIPQAGAVIVFEPSPLIMTQVATLFASDAALGAHLGFAVATDGTSIVAGAPDDAPFSVSSGSAYVFEHVSGSWAQSAKLVPSDPPAYGDGFGRAVVVRGDTAIVGAPFDDDTFQDSGSVYVFHRSGGTWTEAAKLHASDAAFGAAFGFSLAVSGTTLLVGANRGVAGQLVGATYCFEEQAGAWIETQIIVPSDAAPGDLFGFSIALESDTAVIGAVGDDDHGIGSGSAYLYRRNGGTWAFAAKLAALGNGPGSAFGYAAALSEGSALVSVLQDPLLGGARGSVRMFDVDGPDCNSNGIVDSCELLRGSALDCNGNGALDVCDIQSGSSADVNASGTPDECEVLVEFCFGDGPTNGGPDCPCSNNVAIGVARGCTNSTGNGGKLVATGNASLSADTVTLTGSDMAPASFSLFLQSPTNSGAAPYFFDGLRCVGPSFVRLTTKMSVAGAAAIGSPSTPISVLGGIASPGTQYYQVVYRNNAGLCNFLANSTNGVGIAWGS